MMRALAVGALRLYPKVWRRRYEEEVRELVEARPVRFRTVADLLAGAFDARVNRDLIPGGSAMRIPPAAVLTAGGIALIYLWNPGIRQMSSLEATWSHAREHGPIAESLAGVSTAAFTMAPMIAVLAMIPLLVNTVRVVRRSELFAPYGVIAFAPVCLLPAGLIGWLYVSMVFMDVGFPMGVFGNAMTGGFFVPIMLAFLLGLPSTAAGDPMLAPGVRTAGRLLAVAGWATALAWLPIAVLMLMGAEGVTGSFATAVAASAAVSVATSILIATRALGHDRQAVRHLAHA
ncbi:MULTISPECIES: hypothetical protein [unclassified Streptosporangium]|uniref:hypothetical protein n=1 Tax=unclassified Streptosporangium TaxID=2632669 RepID=UPI002E2BDBEE|nr:MULTISPECIES: hypothetical protein [unclassified Streptosporangium]